MDAGVAIRETAEGTRLGTSREEAGGVRRGSGKRLGQLGEDAAARYLQQEGYEVIERNWRCSVGEVDIVARGDDPRQVVLVEVKARRVPCLDAPVAPELAVGPKKRAKYRTLALMYLSLNAEVNAVRFDVIGVGITAEGTAKVRHLPGAYGWDDTL